MTTAELMADCANRKTYGLLCQQNLRLTVPTGEGNLWLTVPTGGEGNLWLTVPTVGERKNLWLTVPTAELTAY